MLERATRALAGCVAITLVSCVPPPPPEVLSDTIDDPEAYAVFEQALLHLGWSAILLRQETTIRIPSFRPDNLRCDPYLNPTHDEWLPVLDDYIKQNGRARTLRPLFQHPAQFRLIPSAEIDNAFRDTPYDWTRFFSQLDSRGYMEVSAVGFDPAETKAVVYGAVHCGGTCGKGVHTTWEKLNGQWVQAAGVLSRNCEWRS